MASEQEPVEGKDFLTLLPIELLVNIIEHIDVASHLNFACTCKKIAECSAVILQRHREAHDQYGVVSDLQPLTIPTLLHNAVVRKDPFVAWHVRSLEIWGPRKSWSHWRPFMLQPPNRFDTGAPPLAWSFGNEERAEYIRLLGDVLHLADDDISRAMKQLDEGNDGILKVLFTALCPRLRNVKYVWCSEGNEDDSLEWLASTIEISRFLESWAPGLRSLRDVSIGVSSGTWLDRDNQAHHDPRLLASLLQLPSIDSIYFHGFYEDGSVQDPSRGLSRGCSTLQHLFIDGAEDMSEEYRVALLDAPRSLKTLRLRGNVRRDQGYWYDIEKFLLNALNAQSASLESLMVHEAWGMRSTRESSRPLYPLHLIEPNTLPHLRHVWLENADLVQQASNYDLYTVPELWQTPSEAALAWVLSRLPTSMEVLLLGNSTEQSDPRMTEDLLIGLLESGRFPRLKAIFIEDDVVRRGQCRQPSCTKHEPRNRLYFQRLVAVGEKHGVDVNCTASGNRRRIHGDDAIGFPPSPDDATALVFSPLDSRARAGTGTGAREFNVFSGRWQPKRCGNCGTCKRCFQVYTKESWKTRSGGSS
ncbi:hypothetical protein CORC01_11054 [Colletotrichum orchidophilum]|uniref:F-box domain-containing protein n=1 Tax=Colletotrichum orchidophilum TaxID=1209926 RepID=A0A1G4AWZ6_9PEZI|nr:uncharacterized protein CORC01_11054 [Colletotrichum orchidophilum]OHE93651.1 hypothetical protein CORC01_11054 [Colletotrichum orchidophilum]